MAKKSQKKLNIKVIDLFCGIGGMTHGFTKEGFKVVAGIDNDITCKYGYETNNKAKFIYKNISDVSHNEIKKLFGKCDVKVLIGCAPCQPFSRLNLKENHKTDYGPLDKFASLINEVKPDIISMENVRGLANEKKYPVFKRFLKVLKNNGYKFSYKIVNCSDYGVPQKRFRLVLLASKLGDISLVAPTHKNKKNTVKMTISKLKPLKNGAIDNSDPLHRVRKLSPLNLKRIKATPHDGGNSRAWSEELKLECHKKESGKTYSGTVYGRMRWDEPAPTMTTQCIGIGNGRFGHPEQNRAISLREAALFQTFPLNYKFSDPKKTLIVSDMTKFIGNAVPVKLGQVIAKSIKKHLRNIYTS